MKIVIPGGSGQVGTMLARAFHRDGHEVVVLSRTPGAAPWRTAAWDAADRRPVGGGAGGRGRRHQPGRAQRQLPLHARRTAAQIMDSRVDSTRAVGAGDHARRPSAARLAAGQHRDHLRPPLRRAQRRGDRASWAATEPDAPDTWRFSIDGGDAPGSTRSPRRTRRAPARCALRSAMVMSPDRGGIFDTLLGLVRLRAGRDGRRAGGSTSRGSTKRTSSAPSAG